MESRSDKFSKSWRVEITGLELLALKKPLSRSSNLESEISLGEKCSRAAERHRFAEFVIAGFSGSGSVRNVQEFKFGVNLLFEVKMFLGKSGTLKEMIHSVHRIAEALHIFYQESSSYGSW